MKEVKTATGLTQAKALANLRAILSSDYFKDYSYSYGNASIFSDIFKVEKIGGLSAKTQEPIKLGDISDTVNAIITGIEKNGKLYEAFITINAPIEKLKALKFEEGCYDEDFMLSLNINIQRIGESDKYSFKIYNLGFKEREFESKGLDFKDAKAKLAKWYSAVTRKVNKILPP